MPNDLGSLLVGDENQRYEVHVIMDGKFQRAGWINDLDSIASRKFIRDLKCRPAINYIEVRDRHDNNKYKFTWRRKDQNAETSDQGSRKATKRAERKRERKNRRRNRK